MINFNSIKKGVDSLLHGDICVGETSTGVFQRSCIKTRIAVVLVIQYQSFRFVHDLPSCQCRMVTQGSYHGLTNYDQSQLKPNR